MYALAGPDLYLQAILAFQLNSFEWVGRGGKKYDRIPVFTTELAKQFFSYIHVRLSCQEIKLFSR